MCPVGAAERHDQHQFRMPGKVTEATTFLGCTEDLKSEQRRLLFLIEKSNNPYGLIDRKEY